MTDLDTRLRALRSTHVTASPPATEIRRAASRRRHVSRRRMAIGATTIIVLVVVAVGATNRANQPVRITTGDAPSPASDSEPHIPTTGRSTRPTAKDLATLQQRRLRIVQQTAVRLCIEDLNLPPGKARTPAQGAAIQLCIDHAHGHYTQDELDVRAGSWNAYFDELLDCMHKFGYSPTVQDSGTDETFTYEPMHSARLNFPAADLAKPHRVSDNTTCAKAASVAERAWRSTHAANGAP